MNLSFQNKRLKCVIAYKFMYDIKSIICTTCLLMTGRNTNRYKLPSRNNQRGEEKKRKGRKETFQFV